MDSPSNLRSTLALGAPELRIAADAATEAGVPASEALQHSAGLEVGAFMDGPKRVPLFDMGGVLALAALASHVRGARALRAVA